MRIKWNLEGEGTRVATIWLPDGNVITINGNHPEANLSVAWETLGPGEEPEARPRATIGDRQADSLVQPTLPEETTLLSVYDENNETAFHIMPDGSSRVDGMEPDEAAQRFIDQLPPVALDAMRKAEEE